MRAPVFGVWAAALVLGPAACDRAPEEHPDDAVRLPRITVVVEVDLFGSADPSVRAHVSRIPSPRSP